MAGLFLSIDLETTAGSIVIRGSGPCCLCRLAELLVLQQFGPDSWRPDVCYNCTTCRLALFLMACKHTLPDTVVEYSSLVAPKERRKHLQAFQDGAARVLVASDAMTRGMDVPGVENVLNYDVPAHATTYLHRIGRTARAGKSGRAITLLKPEDLHHFKALLHKLDNAFVRQWHVNRGNIQSLETTCEQALAAMHEQLSEL